MGDEADIALGGSGTEARPHASVQRLQLRRSSAVVADGVEEPQEFGVFLPVYMVKGDDAVLQFAQDVARKEIRRLVHIAQHCHLVVLYHGRELLQVAYHQQLDAAERPRRVAVAAQNGVDGVEQVGTYHRNLVYHQQVHRAYQLEFVAAEAVDTARALGAGGVAYGELEKRVYGDSSGVDGGDARGSDDYDVLV